MIGAVPLGPLRAAAFKIPTDAPEADGTLAWRETVLVVVEIEAGGKTGLGYTYSAASLVPLIRETLAPCLEDRDALDPPAIAGAMWRAVRNLGRSGMAASAIAAVDTALWDLKAKLLDVPLARLFGRRRSDVPIYGSGGFTSYDDARLGRQLGDWVERDGCHAVKMKIGSDPARDPERMRVAREAIGRAALFIDANGALTVKQAIAMAHEAAELGVIWFEEPVSSDDRAGLASVRPHVRAPMEIAAGEYVWTLDDARHLLAEGAVDVLQADVTRCGGFTGFLAIADLCDAFHLDLSGHCAPALHLHAACAAARFRHLEWFHDHVRIEAMLFDGAPVPHGGRIAPDFSRPGLGLELKAADARRYAVS